jgi:hypothetical protein
MRFVTGVCTDCTGAARDESRRLFFGNQFSEIAILVGHDTSQTSGVWGFNGASPLAKLTELQNTKGEPQYR